MFNSQSGHGLGGIFRKIFRPFKPALSPILKEVKGIGTARLSLRCTYPRICQVCS